MATTSYSLNASPIGVIGAGKLGTTLALALDGKGAPVRWVASKHDASAEALCARLGNARRASADVLCQRASIALITTPDDAVRVLAATLPFRPGLAVVYCSGALDTSVLARARSAGASVGCLHPIQTFPERFDRAERFAGISIGIEASDAALHAWLVEACATLGASMIDLRGVDRARYHAASVLASNYVIALHEAAARAFELAGLPRDAARSALAPLTLGAAQAIERLSLEEALTGPIARGDVATIERQLAALAADGELLALYRALGRRLLELPLRLSPADREKLRSLLAPGAGDR
jgi:predicted short-subunit dehydrogenase-like oxidoreductase (DUF2520 family)